MKNYPDDIVNAPGFHNELPLAEGDAYAKGQFIDEWGCIFGNRSEGIIGEVKQAIVPPADEEWHDTSRIHIVRIAFLKPFDVIKLINATSYAS